MSTTYVLFQGSGSQAVDGLWITDGLASGTSELAVAGADGTGVDPQFITDFNGVALFTGQDSAGAFGLWMTNGNAAGTSEIGGIGSTEITDANPEGLHPQDMTVYDGKILFVGDSGLAGNEYSGLWVSDGTVAGTSEIGGDNNKGIKNADTSGFVYDPDFTLFKGKVLFDAQDKEGQFGLWVTNGTAAGTIQLAPIAGAAFGGDVSPKGYDIQPSNMAVLGNEVIFAGADQEDTPGSLWETNGTAAGTKEIGGEGNKGIADSPFTDPARDLPAGMQPYGMTTFNGEVIFAAMDDVTIPSGTYADAFTLWETNGTAAGTTEIGGVGNSGIANVLPAVDGGLFANESIAYPDFTVFDGEVLFVGTDADNHTGLWETNGIAAGTTEIGGLDGAGISGGLSLNGVSSSPYFTVFGNEVLFVGTDDQGHTGLWVTNGMAAGTYEVGAAASTPYDADLTAFTNGPELYVTNYAQTPASGSHLKAGQVVSVALDMSEDAYVTGKPELALSNGGFATYVGGSGTEILTFKYTVAAKHDTTDLEITSATGGTIKAADGFAADLAGIANTNLGIVIETKAPTITGVQSNPTSGGTLTANETVEIDVDFSQGVAVTGAPTLKLNDGGVAQYSSSTSDPSGGVLKFDYTVSAGQNTSDLLITALSVPGGASIKDLAGNIASLAFTAIEKNLHLTIDGGPKASKPGAALAEPAAIVGGSMQNGNAALLANYIAAGVGNTTVPFGGTVITDAAQTSAQQLLLTALHAQSK